MNILICLNSGKHIPYISPLLQQLNKKNKLFITCYKDGDYQDYIDCVNSLKINELKFIIDTSYLSKFMRNYDEILSLYKFLHYDNLYYSKRFLNYGSFIQKKILSNYFYKIILNFLFKIKILNTLRFILLFFINNNIDMVQQFQFNEINHCIITPGNHKDSAEIEYIRIAKKLNIKSSAIIRSWDVLTTKSIFRYKPDFTFCWNEFHVNSLKKFHNIKTNVIKSGSLFFEKWYDKSNISINKINDKNLIIYFGSSVKIVNDLEADIVIKFNRYLKNFNKQSGKNFEIIFRPHPANDLPIQKIINSGIKVEPLGKNNLVVKKADQINFSNIINKCFFTIGINTSALIDSVILDIPSVALITKDENIIQYQSAHFRHIVDEGIVYKYQFRDENLNNLFSIVNKDSLKSTRNIYVRNNIFINNFKPSELISKIINLE